MGVLSICGVGIGRGAGVGIVGAMLVAAASATVAPPRTRSKPRVAVSAWDAAVRGRAMFEAEPKRRHTRTEYSRVMDAFRAIYHDNPADAHAAKAVEQVAELLAEQGHEFGDPKGLHDAAKQWEFLAKAYPGPSETPLALGQALDLLALDGAESAGEARDVRQQLMSEYPRSAEAKAARETSLRHIVPAIEAHGASKLQVSPLSPTKNLSEFGRDDNALVGRDVVAGSTTATLSGIRHWSTPNYTRVVIDLPSDTGDDVTYQAARVVNPDRIFVDLHRTRLAPGMVGKSFTVTDDGFLTRIRAAQAVGDVTRVVLDVHAVAEYSAFLLPNPERLIIDIHGRPEAGGSLQQPSVEAAPIVRTPAQGSFNAPAVTEVSSLPPMPVTDGSEAFGLGNRSSTRTAKPLAAPRVVIPAKVTLTRPVPNTSTNDAADAGTEVAAVSRQPGKVDATAQPTSQPVSSGSGLSDHYRRPVRATRPTAMSTVAAKHVVGEPVAAAPPTSDGETSLVRALGLKIGRIVIDAGHGGHDSGTLGVGGIEEKDVVLDVALRLGKLLHDRLGAEIVYTRADDTFIPLETRTAIANKAQADLFISIHANSSTDASARGVEVYYLNFTSDPDAMNVASRENAVSTQSVHELSDLVKKIALKDKIEESRELAGDVDSSLYNGLRKGNDGLKDRGVKKAPFVVLIGANMPSILAEISFVTNPDDAEQLQTAAYRERVAESLFAGVKRYEDGVNAGRRSEVERAAFK